MYLLKYNYIVINVVILIYLQNHLNIAGNIAHINALSKN